MRIDSDCEEITVITGYDFGRKEGFVDAFHARAYLRFGTEKFRFMGVFAFKAFPHRAVQE